MPSPSSINEFAYFPLLLYELCSKTWREALFSLLPRKTGQNQSREKPPALYSVCAESQNIFLSYFTKLKETSYPNNTPQFFNFDLDLFHQDLLPDQMTGALEPYYWNVYQRCLNEPGHPDDIKRMECIWISLAQCDAQ